MGAGNFCQEDNRSLEIGIGDMKNYIEFGPYKFLSTKVSKGLIEHNTKDIFLDQKYPTHDMSNLIDTLVRDRTTFLDADLPNMNFILKAKSNQKITCKWTKLQYITKGNPIIVDIPNPEAILVKDQVMQYFGIFLILLAKNKQLIQKIIFTRYNSFGLYFISSYRIPLGHFVIDDMVIANEKMLPIFSQPERNAVWPLLIEKAWLKRNKLNFEGLQNMNPQSPIQQFLCIPTNKIYKQYLQQSERQNFLEFLSTENSYYHFFKSKKFDPEERNDQIVGLRNKSYYALLNTFNIDKQRYFLLRNPSGQFNFRGRWAGLNQAIISSLKFLGIKQLKPGNFVIDEEQLFEYFESYHTVYYIKDYVVHNKQFNFKKNQEKFFNFTIRKRGPIAITIIQDNQLTKLMRVPFMIDLINLDKNQIISLGQTFSYLCKRNTHVFNKIMKELQPGNYLLRLKSKQLNQSVQKSATISVYAHPDQQFEFTNQSKQTQLQQFKNFLFKVGTLQFINSKKIQKKQTFKYLIKWFVNNENDEQLIANRAIIYIENSLKKNQELSVEFFEIENLECVSHENLKGEGINETTIQISQKLEMIIFETKVLNKITTIGKHKIFSD